MLWLRLATLTSLRLSWLVAMPPEGDIHKYVKGKADTTATYDGKTKTGPWADMCEECFAELGSVWAPGAASASS